MCKLHKVFQEIAMIFFSLDKVLPQLSWKGTQ